MPQCRHVIAEYARALALIVYGIGERHAYLAAQLYHVLGTLVIHPAFAMTLPNTGLSIGIDFLNVNRLQ